MTVKSNNTTTLAAQHVVNPSEVGRSQLGRQLNALSRSFFSIESRTVKAWLEYVSSLAKQVNYIDDRTLSAQGTWQGILPEAEKLAGLAKLVESGEADEALVEIASRPDIALLLTFIDLLGHSNAQFNAFVARHLDHFYRQVLKFEPLGASADSAHLVVALNNTDVLTLPAGTQFDGGKDQGGKPLIYSTTEVVTINKANIDHVATVNKTKSSRQIALNHQVLLDTEQGIELTQGEPSFGNGLGATPNAVDVGFKVASQDLFLSGGQREIALHFGDQAQLNDWLDWFNFSVSTSDGVLALDSAQVSVDALHHRLVLTVDSLFPAITHIETTPIAADKALPFITFELKPEYYHLLYGDGSDVYTRFSRFSITQVSLTTKVTGLSGVIANNGEVDLDTSKPFEPFGLAPRLATKLHFTHPELVTKRIINAQIEFAWLDRPDSFHDYYQAYSYFYNQKLNRTNYFDSTATCTSSKSSEEVGESISDLMSPECDCLVWPDSEVKISRSDASDSGQSTQRLFYNPSDNTLPNSENNVALNTLPFASDDNNAKSTFLALPFDETKATLWPKWYTLELSKQDFGHQDYTKVIEYFAYKNATEDEPFLVNPPYTPVLDSLRVHYESESVTSSGQMRGNPIFVEHIAPVGRPSEQMTEQSLVSLLPRMEEFGYLYMAISQMTTPGQVRMYFQVDPVDGYNMGDNPLFVWEYFDQGRWHRFKRGESQGQSGEGRLLSDSSYDLLDSGLVVFYLPELSQSGSFNHDGKLWIRAKLNHAANEMPNQFSNMSPVYSKLKGVFTQGVKVTLTSQDNDATHFEQPLASESLAKLLLPDPRVDKVIQPFASFGAKVAEATSQFDRRVSERLAHRQRLLTGWDYEHFTLQRFSQLHSVRPVVNQQGISLVVVPVNHDVSVLQPKVPRYLKRQIRDQVNALSVPKLVVEVDDPNYVEVQLELIVKIDPLYDIQSTVVELNDMVLDTLTPWNKLDKPLVRTIYLASVAQVLETHPAVDMVQVIRATKGGDAQKHYSVIHADNPHDILVPARNHKISLANTLGDVFEGIGKWEIELDFVVQ
ncbi:hypothetical protein CWB96_06175 [Pseudoalteromonas citrea]|uniref:Baseplate protein J-like domain-containing protein n=1 Tax=Pseudoalteromonas citrea TaxID=43655 RepID=A0A5S3XTD5_9GAMM|nr:hypothetical protein [Pseudoalteromonas citrea]TMP41775.1 hypothetical protein CWB97_13485 [Pseudoalteromonas citrea]TMP60552.1 hypothetical protein CWB96_06175 [Pseudoalteromonas citrea]